MNIQFTEEFSNFSFSTLNCNGLWNMEQDPQEKAVLNNATQLCQQDKHFSS